MTPQEIKTVIDQHTQMRGGTCFQSGVEMALKLYGVIEADSYPEQSIVENDGKGFDPFKGTKTYGEVIVSFLESKHEPISQKALDECSKLLADGVFPVLSFAWHGGFHSAIAFTDSNGEIAFITKEQIGKRYTSIWLQRDIWPHQTKTEILAVRIVQTSNPQK